MASSQQEVDPARELGATVDRRYLLRRPIARGEVHDVYEAEHTWTQMRVALKVLRDPKHAPLALNARLLREARVLGICRHPGLPLAMDAGQCDVFGPYLATELIDGKSLSSVLLTRNQLELGQSLAVAAQLASALDHVHRRGVVHRDVKPENILLTPARGHDPDRVRLIDFGVASVRQEDDVSRSKLTDHGMVLGTRAYMAPEQILGLAGIDQRADVFSLAVVLFECIAGQLPFPTSAGEWMQCFSDGLVPSALPGAGMAFPAQLEQAIHEGLSFEPAKRPPTAGEFIARCVAGWGRSLDPLSLFVEGSTRPEASGWLAGAASGSNPEAVTARRRYVRAPYTTPARIVRRDGASSDGQVEDISEGGLLFVGDGSCEDGEQVTVRVPLPISGKVVALEAVTRWSRRKTGQRALGLQFVDAPELALQEVRRYVELMTS